MAGDDIIRLPEIDKLLEIMDDMDAIVVAIIAVEAFAAIVEDDELSMTAKAGAVLFFEAMMTRVKPKIPVNRATKETLDHIKRLDLLAHTIRLKAGLPTKV